VLWSYSLCVEITTCPVSVLKQPFTLLNQTQVVTNTFGRRLPRCRLINLSRLFIYKSVNRTGTISNHNDLMILTTRFRVELITTVAITKILNTGNVIVGIITLLNRLFVRLDAVINEVLAQRLTEGVGVPQDCLCDVLPCLLLGGVISEGGSHWLVAYESIIGAHRHLW